jgi:hypothetical protein
MNHLFSEITEQLNSITAKQIGEVLLTILISPLLAIGWVVGFIWFIVRGIIAVLIVGFKKGNG